MKEKIREITMEDKKMLKDKEHEKVVTGDGAGTIMICKLCGVQIWWNGDYVDPSFACPTCGERGTFKPGR